MQTETEFSNLVFFGDSYTASGAADGLFLEAFGGSNPFSNPEIYLEGQSNNGLNYSNFLPDLLGVDDGNVSNYAIGGSAALFDRTFAEFVEYTWGAQIDPTTSAGMTRVDLDAQIGRFLDSVTPDDNPAEMAASIFMGINDFYAAASPFAVDQSEANVQQFGDRMFDEILSQAERLADADIGTVILYTVPLCGELPLNAFYPEGQLAAADASTAYYNDRLRTEQEKFEDLGLNVKIIDFEVLFDEVINDFGTFGFQTFDDPQTLDFATINPAVEGIPVDQIAMTDIIHPAEKLNEAMAQFTANSLTGNIEFGTAENDYLKGSKGQDMILGRDGNDVIKLGKGDDVALGGRDDDIVKGGRGDDLISGGSGDDLLTGGKGNDVIADGHGDDFVLGGQGDDVLIDGLGSDFHLGGRGDDVFIFSEQALYGADDSGDTNLFIGGAGEDTLVLRLQSETAEDYANGDISLADLGIKTVGIESIEVVDGLETPDALEDNQLVADAEDWGFL